MEEISFDDFKKLDLRVGEIESVEDIEGADKLYKLSVSLGSEVRTICAGLKEHYSKEDLKGRKIVVLANLAPKVLRGVESKGMLLAAVDESKGKVSLLSVDADIEPGTKVS